MDSKPCEVTIKDIESILGRNAGSCMAPLLPGHSALCSFGTFNPYNGCMDVIHDHIKIEIQHKLSNSQNNIKK